MSVLGSHASVRTEGALLPSDILLRISAEDRSLGGFEPDSYHLDPNERIRDATSRAWNRVQAAWANFDAARRKGEAGASVTRERWLLPLFQLLDFGRLQTAKPETIGSALTPSATVGSTSPFTWSAAPSISTIASKPRAANSNPARTASFRNL
jgi:hypothetical protein